MKITTSRFGEIDIDETKTILFEDGLPGFARARSFIVLPHKPNGTSNSPFKWLQSIEEPSLALPVMNPWLAEPSYSPTVPGFALKELQITNVSTQGRIYAVVTIPRDQPQNATVNLLAPLLINKLTRRGMQVVLAQEKFSLRVPLTQPSSGAGLCEPALAVANTN